MEEQKIDFFTNHDLINMCMPIKVKKLQHLLTKTDYCHTETEFLVKGFTSGFTLGYKGPKDCKDTSKNIPFTPGVGNKIEMWNKIMKEVKLGQFAGPYKDIPFETYVQSPIGLVPKTGGQTQLIFHLSYEFKNGNRSINQHTSKERCTVHYRDIEHAINNCLHHMDLWGSLMSEDGSAKHRDGNRLFFGKTDLKSAFRVAPIKKKHWQYLILKVENPLNGKIAYFVDKCMPFGASISCSHFQRISNALKYIVETLERMWNSITNYLDDFLFIHYIHSICNRLMRRFLAICEEINFPVSHEKSEWATTQIIFLGTLLNGQLFTLMVTQEKKCKTIHLLHIALEKRTITIKDIQCLTGMLNFLKRAIVPGRTFTRRMYAKLSMKMMNSQGKMLKQHHHVSLDREFKNDCAIWIEFLTNQMAVTRPFSDFRPQQAVNIGFFTDASKNPSLGFGCFFDNEWTFGQWENGFIEKHDPSIAYLELYALCIGILTWSNRPQLMNSKILIFCGNQLVVHMVNQMSSGCKNCMYLLRILAVNNIIHNRQISVQYIETKKNVLADLLSHLWIEHFLQVVPTGTRLLLTPLPEQLWPLSRIW